MRRAGHSRSSDAIVIIITSLSQLPPTPPSMQMEGIFSLIFCAEHLFPFCYITPTTCISTQTHANTNTLQVTMNGTGFLYTSTLYTSAYLGNFVRTLTHTHTHAHAHINSHINANNCTKTHTRSHTHTHAQTPIHTPTHRASRRCTPAASHPPPRTPPLRV